MILTENKKLINTFKNVVERRSLCNMRASELVNLNISDLPISHGKNCIWIRNSKGNISRTIEIPERLQKRLERFVKLYRKEAGEDQEQKDDLPLYL